MGISIYPDDADNADEMVKAADTAMYHAKGRGRSNFQFYTTDLTSKALERFFVEKGLRQALREGEFVLHYQPQVAVSDGRMVGVEHSFGGNTRSVVFSCLGRLLLLRTRRS